MTDVELLHDTVFEREFSRLLAGLAIDQITPVGTPLTGLMATVVNDGHGAGCAGPNGIYLWDLETDETALVGWDDVESFDPEGGTVVTTDGDTIWFDISASELGGWSSAARVITANVGSFSCEPEAPTTAPVSRLVPSREFPMIRLIETSSGQREWTAIAGAHTDTKSRGFGPLRFPGASSATSLTAARATTTGFSAPRSI